MCTDGRNLPQIKQCLGGESLAFQLALPPIDHFQDFCKSIQEAVTQNQVLRHILLTTLKLNSHNTIKA